MQYSVIILSSLTAAIKSTSIKIKDDHIDFDKIVNHYSPVAE